MEKMVVTSILLLLAKCFRKGSSSGSLKLGTNKGQRLTLSETINSRLFQTDRVGENFKFDESGGKFSKREKKKKNTVGKGEIARHEQFHLFPPCFRKICTADT